ncbi:hypothetical protein KC360_g4307 [Hortaea werneckii]|nr:hypothetical protein KC325_g7647 [Hortaea werneckii]KAI6993675.1 hypothetical protein KC359_g5011 [Hortaea werneckii]KAI7145593.1 hypothetical protein KC344_g4331 [Hortaea werneckii]KAI7174330.1 hypothetical protein KC360_g4307 [Hortaea werneckii]
MVPRVSDPPTRHHPALTKSLKPAAAETKLAGFLEKTQTQPYLHPDAQLSLAGITYSAQSGPTGGLAIHHLKRINAGLKGENLVAETADELAMFGGEAALPEGDDSKLDATVEAKSDEKKKGVLKRKRSTEEVGKWAEQSSEAAFDEAQAGAAAEDWQDREEYEQNQQPLEGEVGEREGAPATKQGGQPPVVQHAGGDEHKELSAADKKARKEAKKARADHSYESCFETSSDQINESHNVDDNVGSVERQIAKRKRDEQDCSGPGLSNKLRRQGQAPDVEVDCSHDDEPLPVPSPYTTGTAEQETHRSRPSTVANGALCQRVPGHRSALVPPDILDLTQVLRSCQIPAPHGQDGGQMPLHESPVPDSVLEQMTTTLPLAASPSFWDTEQDQRSDDDVGSPDGSPTSVAPLSTFSDVQIWVVPPPASGFLGSNDSRVQDIEPNDVKVSSEQGYGDGRSPSNAIDADAFGDVHRSRTPSPEETPLLNDHSNASSSSPLEDLFLVQSQGDEELQEAIMALSLTRTLLALERPGDGEEELEGSYQSK